MYVIGRMQKGECDSPVRIYGRIIVGAYRIRPNIVFAPMQCINIHCKIHGILSNASHPGIKQIVVYRRDDETRVCKKTVVLLLPLEAISKNCFCSVVGY